MKCDKKWMRLCAVTDRRWTGNRPLLWQLEEALKGGVTCVQYREKNLPNERLTAEIHAAAQLCRNYGVPFLINDFADLAVAGNADGVHVGQNENIREIRRRIGEDRLLGVSVHTVQEAQRAVREGADYLGVGAVFPTTTKADAHPLSARTLRDICAAVKIPVVAIGGIRAENILRLSGTGVDGVAVVSALFAAKDPRREAAKLLHLSCRMAGQETGKEERIDENSIDDRRE